MSKNQLLDVHNHMVGLLELLSDPEVKGDDLKEAIQRSQAAARIADTIVDNARLNLEAAKARSEYYGCALNLPGMMDKGQDLPQGGCPHRNLPPGESDGT